MKEEKAAGAEVSAVCGYTFALSDSRPLSFEQPQIPAIGRETAYNLQIIFLMTGATDLCRKVTEEWLGI